MSAKFVYTKTLLDTSALPDAPNVDRSYGCQVLKWRGIEYLIQSRGNQLEMFDFSNPLRPRSIGQTSFAYHPDGDVDYNLFNFAIGVDARYGLCGFGPMGCELLDLGPGDTPNLHVHAYYPHAKGLGGCAFRIGTQDYLVLRELTAGRKSQLVAINGLHAAEMHWIQDIVDEAGRPVTVAGGWFIPGIPAEPGYLYLVGQDWWVHPYAIKASGAYIKLIPRPKITRGSWCQTRGIDVDVIHGVMVGTSPAGCELLSILDPANPVVEAKWKPFGAQNAASAVGIRFPWLWVGIARASSMVKTYDISDLANPVEVSAGTWTAGQPCQSFRNMADECAAFTEDGKLMARSSASVLEIFKVKES